MKQVKNLQTGVSFLWRVALLSWMVAAFCIPAASADQGGIKAPATRSFNLKTIYKALGEKGEAAGQREIHWIARQEKKGDSGVITQFYRASGKDLSPGDSPVCGITTSPGEEGQKFCWQTPSRNDICAEGDALLVIPGFPVPCDLLPLKHDPPDKVFVNRSTAGGRVFEWRYRVEKSPVKLSEAISAGFVDASIEKIPADARLVMVQAVDLSGKKWVRQLWLESHDWWIYEETADRKSWRVGN